ncbi:MAG: DegV family protein [Bacilli bacterium]|nr:DegV family protein [Bacilli bacterium]
MSIKIFADAASNLFQSILKRKELEIHVMNMHLTIGDREYNCYDDEIDIDEFSHIYYSEMKEGKKVRTSLVGPGDYLEAFEKEVSVGNQIICFTMAKGISGTYNSACLAKDEINEKYEKEMVYVVDSMTAGLGEGLQAIHAAELVKKGTTFEELKQECEEFKYDVRSEFTVDNIKYLLSTGRVNKLLSRFINLVKVKILLKNNENSKIAFAGSTIGRKTSIKKLAKMVLEKIDHKREQIVYITHCDCIEDAKKLKALLEEGNVKNIETYAYDLISGAHIGPDSLAVFYVAKKKKQK